MDNKADDIIELVTKVIVAARNFTPRETVELGVVHGLCMDAATKNAPHLIEFLSSVRGLVAITATLLQLPHVVTPNDAGGWTWTFVRTH
ncbi:hypothetical protein N7E02_06925 (plasmid) [Aliirhizobium terrae]|uniref:hypothetical protein n=1 Tax=Terrirhizobium terrae TaxID=2926709 RepID=UPI002578A09A|nr:hypothetical protein [Rhizobium sp. CC-CFT758]WJH38372.1 hypothetical protein N7E02_06925 [Rhizobium sp. CC-CFT758]